MVVEFAGAEEVGKDVAMHIAAMKPEALIADGVKSRPTSSRRNARSPSEKAAESGKPAEIVAKMVEGSVQKFLKEVSLLNQVFVKAADDKQTVDQMLKAKGATITKFALFVVGEGIEKKARRLRRRGGRQVAAAGRA